MIRSREDIPQIVNRIVIKAGTSVVTSADGYVSISHLANIVEHTARLFLAGKQVGNSANASIDASDLWS